MSHQNTGESDLEAMTSAWSSITRSVLESATAANRATMAAFLAPATANGQPTDDTETRPSAEPSVEYERADWEFERTVDSPEKLEVGDTVTFEKRLTDEDVRAFAATSGDTNRLHLDEEFAAETRFSGRIVHGTLVSGLISAALARLPGLTIYLSQDLEFRDPVGVGDRVSARVEILEALGHDQYRLETTVRDEDTDTLVIEGEAVVLIDDPHGEN